jgi:putative copper export protein
MLLLLHLLGAAFWIGSLVPLAWATRRSGPEAARVIERWARISVLVVPMQLAVGLLLAWVLLGSIEMLLTSRYGWALLAKVGLVAALLGLAAWHRQRLTPALNRGLPGAGTRLARSIWMEATIAAAVLYVAAEVVATSPGDLLRGPG